MKISVPLIVVSATLVAGLGLLWLRESSAVSEIPGEKTEINTDHIQIDYQKGVKVVATYLPGESTPTEARVLAEITSENENIADFPYREKIIWADTNIDPLPTLDAIELTREQKKLLVKMTFRRNEGSHYHFWLKDLSGVKDRMLHFYGL
ncbi:MAG TPA: hypothetical protein VFK94_07210 [Patescibacteria group bacterium]|nr:hypothetical protein [Patescibacteria group bacterium]